MNIIKHNMSRIAFCMLFFVVSIQAADKNELKNSKETNNEKQNNILPAETLPPGYVEPTQPAEGIKFALPSAIGNNQKFSAQKETGIKSNNGFLPERADDSVVERIIDKYLQGESLTTYEEQILRNNINEIPYPGDGVFRPSITETSAVSRNASDLFFSEYSEGSGNNKYLEIYNGTGESADLSNYLIRYSQNGASTWNSTELGLSGTLLDGEVYVVAHSSADATILAEADTTESSISAFNGDDVRGLFKVADNDTSIIDIIGTLGSDPGSGWDVAGVTNATKDHTLVRKSSVSSGNTNWSTSAGTTTDNSEWIVYDLQTWSYLGSHTMILPNLLSEGFESGSIPENWSLLNLDNHSANWYAYESSFYAHSGSFLARVYYRPLSAAPQNQPSDDWLITPKLDVVSGDSISFWARSSNSNPYESFNVRVSSTNAESAASFTDTLASVATVPTTWTRYVYALESYAEQDIYIAVQHNTYDGWYLYVDDFSGPQVWIDDSPVIALNKDSINYGNTGLGGMSESVVIENLGASDLVVSSVASSNSDFTISTSSLTLTGGGDLETITITYTPTAVEGDTAHVVFTHNGSTSPDSIMVMGAGKDAIYWQDFESWAAEVGLAVPQPLGVSQEGNMTWSADGASNGWEKATGTGNAYDGEYSAEFDSYESSVNGDTSAFILPAIEYTTTAIAAVEGALRFYMKKRGTEEFYVSHSTDNGNSWTKAFSDTTENYSTGIIGWVSVSINVPLGATYIFKMVGKGNRQSVAGDIYVDQLSFVEVPPTPELSLIYSSIGYMPQILGETTGNTRFNVGTNSGSAALVIDSISTANADFSVLLSAEITNNTIEPGGNVDLDMLWSPSVFGLKKTNAIIYHNADTSPDTIAFSGEAGRSYVSFDENDDSQGAAFSGSLPWQWQNIDLDGDGNAWLFNYSYYGPGYTGSPLGYYARSAGGGERLETRTLIPQTGDSLIFYYNSSNSADSGYIYIQAKILGTNTGFVSLDSVRLSGYSNQRAAMSLAHYAGDSIIIALQDDHTYNSYNYHRVDDMLMSTYEIANTSVFVLGLDTLELSTPPTIGTPPTTPASESVLLSNMGSVAMVVSSVVSDNPVFAATLANSTVEGEEETELTVTFSPSLGGVQTGNIILLHDGPSSPDTLYVIGDGGPATYVAGVVTGDDNSNPLDSVMVTVWGTGGVTYTNTAGEYGYYGSLQGLTGVGFEKEGYHNALFNVNLVDNDTVNLNAALQPLDINSLYSSGFENGDDNGLSEVNVGTNAFAVSNMFVTVDEDTILPKSGSSMLMFPDSASYENNDMVFWVSDSTFDLTGASGRLTFSVDVNIDTEEGFDFFYFCLRLDDGIAWYTSNVGLISGTTGGWDHLDIDMSWVLDGRSATATPCILFSADGGVTASGGAFDNLSVAWDPFFLAPPSELSLTNYGTSIPLSWEAPEESGRATYTIRAIDLREDELPTRPMIMGDDGLLAESVKGEREFPISTVLYNYNNQPSRSLIGYNVFKRDWPFGLWELGTSVSNNTYEDAAVADGGYYEYAVSAVYDEGESYWIGFLGARAGTPVVVTDDVFDVEDFEEANFSWENWDVFYSSDAAMWMVGDSADASSAFGDGALSAPEHSTFAYVSDGRANDENFATWLVSPFIDFIDNHTAIVHMSGYAQVYGDFANNNVVQLLVRSDMGPWEIAVNFGYDHLDGWEDYSASVGELVSGRDKAQFALLYTHTADLNSGYGNGVAFDDLYIETIPGPHSLTSTSGLSNVSLSWLHPDSSMFTNLVSQEPPQPFAGNAIKTDLIISDNNRELTCFNPALSSLAYYWGFGEGFGIWSITEFDADTVPLLSVSATFYNTASTMSSTLQAEVLVAIIDTLDVNIGTMDTIFHSYETIETDDVLGVKVHTVTLSDTFFNQPDQAVFVVIRPQTEAVWGIDGTDTTFYVAPFFMSDDGASWSGLSGQADSLGNFFTQGGASFGMDDWVDFSIDLCADVPPPDISYNVYKDGSMVAEEVEENMWIDEYVSATTEACYQVHGVVPRYLNIGSEVLYVMHETDPTNEECASALNAAPGAFSLTTPPDGYTSIIRPENIDGSQLFAWSLSADPNGQPVNYTITWTATVNGATVSIDQDTSGRVVMVPLADIYGVLEDNGVEDTLGFHWNVVSTDGQLTTDASNGPRYVIFDIGYMLSSEEELGIPDVFALHQNYPNPFNPVTTIRYDVPEQSNIRVDIYNVLGQKVAELVNKTHQPGFYAVSWDGTNTMGSALGSGMYFYRIDAEKFTAVKKLLLVK